MGIRIEDANAEQKAFLDDIRKDPTKGDAWIQVMACIVDGLAVMVELRREARAAGKELDPVLTRFLIRTMGHKATEINDSLFPYDKTDDKDRNPTGPAIRLDVVKYCHLGGFISPDQQWNEANLHLEPQS